MKKESNRSKIRGILVSLLIVVILLLVIIALFIYFYGSGITGNVIYNGGNYSGTGFAPPYDTANPSTLLFSVNPELASSSNGNVSISVSAARDSGVIFKTGYYFDNSTSNWIAFNFSEPTIGTSNWISGSASAALSIPVSQMRVGGRNLIVAYVCKKQGDVWKCGCEDASDSACDKWMLQLFNVSSSSGGPGPGPQPGPDGLYTVYQENGNQYGDAIIYPNQGFYFVNYTKPLGASSAVWMVKHGIVNTYNITLPDSCFNVVGLDKLVLRIHTDSYNTGGVSSYPECYNGTDWAFVGNRSGNTGGADGVNGYTTYMHDGNWNTYATNIQWQNPGGWRISDLNTGARVYEEAIYWKFTSSPSVSFSSDQLCSSDVNCTNGKVCTAGICNDTTLRPCTASDPIGAYCSGGIKFTDGYVRYPLDLNSNMPQAINFCGNLTNGPYGNWTLPSFSQGCGFPSIFNGHLTKDSSQGCCLVTYSMGCRGACNGCDSVTFTGSLMCIRSTANDGPIVGTLGTASNPFVISTCQDLQNIRNNLTASYILANDVDCSMTKTWNYNSTTGTYAGFAPIDGFSGTLNGSYHKIDSLYIFRTDGLNNALFSNTNNANLFNFGLTNINFTSGSIGSNRIYSAALIGWKGGGRVDSVYATGTISSIGSWVDMAGLVGFANGYGSSLTNSYFIGTINNLGTVLRTSGVVGYINGQTTNNLYTASTLNVPYNGDCLLGSPYPTSGISNSYFDLNLCNKGSNYALGNTTAQMKQQGNYVGWDFTNTWAIDPAKNNGYPYLKGFNL